MALIDWTSVGRGALWIAGLSIALAAWSHLSWWASARHVRVRRAVMQPAFLVPFWAGLVLIAASLAWAAAQPWARLTWIALGFLFAWQVVAGWRAARRSGHWLDATPP
jgi:hypothetical protein